MGGGIVLVTLGYGAKVAGLSGAGLRFVRPPAGVGHPEQLRRLYRRTNWSVGGVTEIRSEFSFASYRAIRDAARDRVVVAAYTVPDTEAVDRTGAHGLVAHATSS